MNGLPNATDYSPRTITIGAPRNEILATIERLAATDIICKQCLVAYRMGQITLEGMVCLLIKELVKAKEAFYQQLVSHLFPLPQTFVTWQGKDTGECITIESGVPVNLEPGADTPVVSSALVPPCPYCARPQAYAGMCRCQDDE